MKVKIKGQDWKIKLLTSPKYIAKFESTSMALTNGDDKTIYFDRDVINIGIIRHELLHAFFFETHVESANLTPLQVEEVCCSLVENEFDTIDKLSKKVWRNASKFRKELKA